MPMRKFKIALHTLLNIRHLLHSFKPVLHFSLIKHILLLSILIIQAKKLTESSKENC